MISYTEKGFGMHLAIEAAGHWIRESGKGNWESSDDVAVQAIIDAYDPLPYYKEQRIKEIKEEGLSRVQAVFPAIKDFDDLDLVREQFLSIAPAARQATTDFQSMIDIVTAGKTAVASVNSAVDEAAVNAVVVAWP